jgi:aspartyl-tRNA(Asn)/glutamyl-tRNA(Gln) amidotransferase subunit B
MISYETVIGLEVHVQLNTRSKAFCADPVQFGAEPNTLVSPVSLAHPGTLPRLNKEQVKKAVQLGLALGSSISMWCDFDRKNYTYPDLPKGYQLTQDHQPICIGGLLPVRIGDTWKKIRIHHIHMEEDAGKNIHDLDPNYSLVDLNRAGTPLLEVVTEPDLRSAEEVDAFMTAMRQLVRYLDISDGNMQEGSLRCDCNVSIREKGSTELNSRCEIKNLNSMRFARQAVAYEVKRQISIVEAGGIVEQQTLNFNPETRETSPIRSKEEAIDYRYFPEPDLPPVKLTPEFIKQLESTQPALPWELHGKLVEEMGLSFDQATLLTEESAMVEKFLSLCGNYPNKELATNFFIQKVRPFLLENDFSFPIQAGSIHAFLQLIDSQSVSNSVAFEKLYPEMLANPGKDPKQLAAEMDLFQTKNEDFLEALVEEVLNAYPEKVKAFKNGKKGLSGFFMGEIMKKSKGKANPKAVQEILLARLQEN